MSQQQQAVTPTTSEVKQEEQDVKKDPAPQADGAGKVEAPPTPTDSQAGTKPEVKEARLDLAKIEEEISKLPPEQVQEFQRNLSNKAKQNLFQGEVGELFKKYKSLVEKDDGASQQPQQQPQQPQAPDQSKEVEALREQLLKAKIENELIKHGVSGEFLEEATIVAQSKVKTEAELEKVKDISTKFSSLKQSAPPPPAQTSAVVGGGRRLINEGEAAVDFLKRLNPKGFK